MKTNNPLADKSCACAQRRVTRHRHLGEKHREFVLPQQSLQNVTAIKENAEKVVGGPVKKDLRQKISIAYREAREAHYGLHSFHASPVVEEVQISNLLDCCSEILTISGSLLISLTSKNS